MRTPSHFFSGFSLRQRFLVAPLLGLVMCSLLTAAFVYESQRKSALVMRMQKDLTAFNRYAGVFVNLTEQHMELDHLFDDAGKGDEAALYDQAKVHLYKVQKAVHELESAVPSRESATPDFAALRVELAADVQAYRNAATGAVAMTTVDTALAPAHLARMNNLFNKMNRTFIALLELERTRIDEETTARIRESRASSATIAVSGISIAALLFLFSSVLSRMLSRSIQTQIGLLTELGMQAGAPGASEGSDEVGRMTHAIAAFRHSLLDLRESERRFSEVLRKVQLASLMLDREGRITYCNDYLLRLAGWEREDVIGRDWFELFTPPEYAEDLKVFFAALLDDHPDTAHHDDEILTRAGERRLIRWNNSVLRSGSGDVVGTASIGEDITEQRRAEISIKRLNRVYAVLSGINTLIVRVRDRDELFRESCRVAVEQGHFKMAWIGVVDRSAMKILPVASAGAEPEFLALIRDRFSLRDEPPPGSTLTARAVREGRAMVSNAIHGDPNVLYGKHHVDRGIASLAILPLMVSGEAVGVLALYSDEVGFFDDAEMKLLTALAGDIAFALDHLEKEARLDYLAYYDALTGLANRTLFLERVAQYMRSAAAGGHKLALYLVDLERFKNINDSLGQAAGDALLRQVAQWLTGTVSDANLLARVGADHFAVVMPEVKQEGEVARILEKMMAAFVEHPYHLNGAVYRIAAKVGVAIFPDDGADADTLFRNAEAALKKAKASADRYLFYTQKMTAAVAGRLTLENQLRQALDNEELVLHYQPKVNLASGKLTSAEALIRWNDPRTGLVPPGRFIPVLEETGLIYEVGRWAMRKAIEDYLRWRAAGLAAVRIAVNVSPLQLRSRGFVAEVERAIGLDAHAAAGLELEITESMLMGEVENSIATLKAIRAMGVSIAIDDFGTGFSSLSYLSRLPVDALKIDRSFVVEMTLAPEGLALVSTIISLAHSLKLKVVAEGVETEEQSRLLRLLSCDEMQGYLFCKPIPAASFEARFLSPPAPFAKVA